MKSDKVGLREETHEYEFIPGTILDRKTGRRIFIKGVLALGALGFGARLPLIEQASGAVAYWDTPPYTYYYAEKSSWGIASADVSQNPAEGKILMNCFTSGFGSAYAMAYYDTNYAYPAIKKPLQMAKFPISSIDELFSITYARSDLKSAKKDNTTVFVKKISKIIAASLESDLPIHNAEDFMRKLQEKDPKITIRIVGKGMI